MAYLERFTGAAPASSYLESEAKQRVRIISDRVDALPVSALSEPDWQVTANDAEGGPTGFKPDWKLVTVSVCDTIYALESVAVVTPWQDDDGREVGRFLTLIAKTFGGSKDGYDTVGMLFPSRYQGGDPIIMVYSNVDPDMPETVPLLSADADVFMYVAEQVLPGPT